MSGILSALRLRRCKENTHQRCHRKIIVNLPRLVYYPLAPDPQATNDQAKRHEDDSRHEQRQPFGRSQTPHVVCHFEDE